MRRALAIDETEPLRPGSPRCGDPPQQSRGAASGHEPPRRSRAADAPRARRSTREATARIIPMWRSPQQSRGTASGHEPPRRGRAADAPRAGDRRDKLRPGSSQCCGPPQQSRDLLRSHKPPRPRPSRCCAARWRSTRGALGDDHPKVAIGLNNLALLLQATNRLAEAEPLMRRALAIDETSYGPDHPNVAIRLNNFAQLLQATNRLAEAEPLMRRALAIFEASLGPDHPNTVTARNNLAALEAALAKAAGERRFIHRPHPEEPAQRASRRRSSWRWRSCVLDGPSRRAFGAPQDEVLRVAHDDARPTLKSGRRWSASGRGGRGRGRGA